MRLAKLCAGNGYGMTVKTQKERNHWFQFFATQCLQCKNIGESQKNNLAMSNISSFSWSTLHNDTVVN